MVDFPLRAGQVDLTEKSASHHLEAPGTISERFLAFPGKLSKVSKIDIFKKLPFSVNSWDLSQQTTDLDDNLSNHYIKTCFNALGEPWGTISGHFSKIVENRPKCRKSTFFNFRKRVRSEVRGGPPGLKLRQKIPQDISWKRFCQISWMCSKSC